MIFLIRDFNVKIGTADTGFGDIIGKERMYTRNENGNLLLKLCGICQMKIGVTLFTHKNNHKVTWTSPGGMTSNLIDR